jgi:hypothetical protein
MVTILGHNSSPLVAIAHFNHHLPFDPERDALHPFEFDLMVSRAQSRTI